MIGPNPELQFLTLHACCVLYLILANTPCGVKQREWCAHVLSRFVCFFSKVDCLLKLLIDGMLVIGSGRKVQSMIVLGKEEYFMQSLIVEMIYCRRLHGDAVNDVGLFVCTSRRVSIDRDK